MVSTRYWKKASVAKVKALIGNILENEIGEVGVVDILQRLPSPSKELTFLIFKSFDSSSPA